jgi:hypothetical protein
MIEMNSALPLDRNNTTTALPVDTLRPAVESAAAPAPRQAEVPPGVEVQISTAAREAAARDPVPANSDAIATASATASETGSASVPPAAPDGGSNTASATQVSFTQDRAMQMFNETAGIGLEQANPSPLRDIV